MKRLGHRIHLSAESSIDLNLLGCLRLSLVICKSLLEVITALTQFCFPRTLGPCHVSVDLRFSTRLRPFQARHSIHVIAISLEYFFLLSIDWCFDLLLEFLALESLIEIAVLRVKVAQKGKHPLLVSLSTYQVSVQFVQLLSKVIVV